MRKILFALATLVLISCKKENKEGIVVAEKPVLEVINNQTADNAIIYEANIRQYSPEGTFEAFTKDIPQLKELGVKIIWLMPIYPISETKRKATGGENSKFVSEMPENEQSKYLGSYYAISDYTAINPEFGTIEDFRKLVVTAHENGMYVILDWVANHTGWDHTWIKTNPEFYTQNDKGEIMDPLNPETGESWGWTDVADLNYGNKELYKAMIAEMQYWVEKEGIDGFRCDVAGEVPTEFWETANKSLNTVKPVFMLAEADKAELLKNAFDAQYAWEGHHILNEIAKGKMTVKNLDAYMQKIDTVLQPDDIYMNFVTNHDENSWNGTIQERMGNASEAMTALTYVMPGIPLIYSGQEYGLNHRLKFFEKDSIPKTKGKEWDLLTKLGKLKTENPALAGGKEKADYIRLVTSNENVLAFVRKKGGNKVLFIANLSDNTNKFTIPLTGEFENYISTDKISLLDRLELEFQPWQYWILVQ